MYYVYSSTLSHIRMYVCTYNTIWEYMLSTFTKDTQRIDLYYGIPRAKPEVFRTMIHFLCFLPKCGICK